MPLKKESQEKWYSLFQETNNKYRQAVEKISKKSNHPTLPLADIVQQCTLQGGTHHTNLVLAVSNGRPLDSYTIPGLVLQWYQIVKENDGSILERGIKGAIGCYYQPSVNDIGHTLLLKITWKGNATPVVLEYGPIIYGKRVI